MLVNKYIRNFLLMVLLLCCQNQFAQTKDYYSLKEVVRNRFVKLEINTQSEALQFAKNAEKLFYISSIRINGDVDVLTVLRAALKIDELTDIQFKRFNNFPSKALLDSLIYIESITIYSNEENTERIADLASLPTLNSLTIYLDEKVENYKFLKPFERKINNLSLIGDLLPRHLEEITNILSSFPFLNTLSLSVDRLTDLPSSLSSLKMLSTLNLYDNLSRAAGNGIEDLGVEYFEIIYDKEYDVSKGIRINYFSDNNSLSEFERDRLIAIWKGELFVTNAKIPETFSLNSDSAGAIISFAQAPSIDFVSSPALSPPYERIKKQGEIFAIDPHKAAILHTLNGINALIPAESFVDDENNSPAETVYVRITHLENQADLLFTGVPMKAIGGSDPEYFSSKTMFNIVASTSKNNLKLKEGRQIKVEYFGDNDTLAGNYLLDPESKSWFDLRIYYYSDAGIIPQDFYNLKQSPSSENYYHLDNSDFNSRFFSENNYFLNDAFTTVQNIVIEGKYVVKPQQNWEVQNINKIYVKVKKGRSLIKIQRLAPKDAVKGFIYFRLTDKLNNLLFPELKPFSKFNFIYISSKEDKKEFTREYVSQMKYNDIRIKYVSGNEFCLITLKTDEGFIQIKALITDEKSVKKKAKEIAFFSKLYKKYSTSLAARENAFNNSILNRATAYKQYFSSRENSMNKTKKLQEIRIRELGVFAAMTEEKTGATSEIIAAYTDNGGLPIDVKQVYVIQKNINSVQVLKPGNIMLDLVNTSLIAVIDYTGNFYYLTAKDLKSLNLTSNSLVYFRMTKLLPATKTIEDVISITGLKAE
ncbi:MAG: hypothetical protein H7321_05560 [Bacteroidia bacterium]|nr:hypothetical protein [Bacteroidia bacterium]